LNTKNIKIVAAVQPGFKLPAVVAKLSTNIQNQLSNGRFALSGIAGWWKLEVESYGDIWLPHSDRYTIINRLKEYECVGVDLIGLKFESMLEDTICFHELVIFKYTQQNSL
jgi:hypothetical protein